MVERDRHGRLVAKVFLPDGVDVGGRLVLAGWALAYRRYSMDYVDAEDEARKAKRGMWRGTPRVSAFNHLVVKPRQGAYHRNYRRF